MDRESLECAHLENLLHSTGSLVVLLSDDVGVQDTGGGVQGVYSRVDAQLGNTTRQHCGGVQMSECGGRGRVSQVISRHVDGLFAEAGVCKHSCHVSQIIICMNESPLKQFFHIKYLRTIITV